MEQNHTDAILALLKDQPHVLSLDLAATFGLDHQAVVGLLLKLESEAYITKEVLSTQQFVLTNEGAQYHSTNSPEYQIYAAVPPEGIKLDELKKNFDANLFKIGLGNAVSGKYIENKQGLVTRVAPDLQDQVKLQLAQVLNKEAISKDVAAALKKRKLINEETIKQFKIVKGPEYAPVFQKKIADLTTELLQSGKWAEAQFKEINLRAHGKLISQGNLHPLLKVRREFVSILISMGFEEMPTNQFVESSFWNFDALFQPQQHPARDAHDTFFCSDPALSEPVDAALCERVKNMHEKGGVGSIGYNYNWSLDEARKNILRTHTTAVSSKMLHRIAQEYKEKGYFPKKYFSIDRVFRNEKLDATHLAEFFQFEGIVIDKDATLGSLMGIIKEFFGRIGIKKLWFKPTYNPYTEPSMEIYGFHPILQKRVEIGNSGVFRPEMLEPLGFPPNVNVIAWGLSLERPTMIYYNVQDIREMVGSGVEIKTVRQNPFCIFK